MILIIGQFNKYVVHNMLIHKYIIISLSIMLLIYDEVIMLFIYVNYFCLYINVFHKLLIINVLTQVIYH